jgi:histidinol phosphatase-like PHP family hydrolase
LRAYVGAEADILDHDGGTTCSLRQKESLGLDYLLGSVHLNPGLVPEVSDYVEEEFRRHLGMLRNAPQVDVLAHPWGQGIRWQRNGSIDQWSFDLVPEDYQDCLIEEALKVGKAIELNLIGKNSLADPAERRFVRKLIDSGVKISVASDAHELEAISRALLVNDLLEEMGVDDRQLWMPNV